MLLERLIVLVDRLCLYGIVGRNVVGVLIVYLNDLTGFVDGPDIDRHAESMSLTNPCRIGDRFGLSVIYAGNAVSMKLRRRDVAIEIGDLGRRILDGDLLAGIQAEGDILHLALQASSLDGIDNACSGLLIACRRGVLFDLDDQLGR